MQATDFYEIAEQGTPIILAFIKKTDDFSVLGKDLHQAELQQFTGEYGEFLCLGNSKGRLNKIWIGHGNGNDKQAIAQVVNHLPEGLYEMESTLSHEALVIWSLAQYRYDAYKKKTMKYRRLKVSSKLWPEVNAESTAVFKVRDLINAPANSVGPEALSNALSALAMLYNAQFEVCVGDDLIQANYPAIHAVGRAAGEAPRLASLTWGNPEHPKVTFVGKGVCFDSGGLDIKSSSNMRLMKKDMGGAAHVIGIAEWIMMLNLPIHLQVFVPAVENAIGSRAYRPGDILTMRNGLTVEIDNTDAEGRLILADALAKACENKPDLLIDFATLTGAARVAVGTEISAFFTNQDEVAEGLEKASKEQDDFVWRLPLFKGYQGMIDSSVADLSNSGASPYAGAITAALFLEHFVEPSIPWVHFDVMAWNVSNKPGKPEGGEAMGLRAVMQYLKMWIKCQKN